MVESNNYLSLLSGLPISIFDIDKFEYPLTIRHGIKDEKYVFNQSGQLLDLEDLILVADKNKAIGTPVKDSMATKVFEDAKNVVGVIYSTKSVTNEDKMKEYNKVFEDILVKYCNADNTKSYVL